MTSEATVVESSERGGGALWRRILTVAWCSVLLGVAIEFVLVAIAAGSGTLKGLPPVVSDGLQKVSWSFLVCTGVACGTVAARASAAMGVLGLVFGPLAFSVSKAVHKAANQALSISTAAASGPSPYWIAAIKGIEYGFLGACVGWIASRRMGLGAYVAAGAVAGILFGGWILLRMVTEAEPALAGPAIAIRAANEMLFPIGCAFVLYVADALQKRLR